MVSCGDEAEMGGESEQEIIPTAAALRFAGRGGEIITIKIIIIIS
jgi:hypothetical protein